MMKKIFFGAIAALTMTACSNDELVKVNNSSNEIKFAVTAENNTRAQDVFCCSNIPGEFNVYAWYDGKVYIDGDIISGSNGSWKNESGTRYWPETETNKVDFYAAVALSKNGEEFKLDKTLFEMNKNAPSFGTFTPAIKTADQVDLLYAVKKNQGKPEDGKVSLNFRHALSQIVFNAKNENENLHVVIDGVSVVKVANSGTYTFPTESTDTKLNHNYGDAENFDDATAYPSPYNTHGTWDYSKATSSSYSVSFDEVTVKNTVNLTDWSNHKSESASTAANAADKSKAMLLIPQTTTKFDVTKKINADDNTGSYFLVSCKIYNVAGSEFNESTDVLLWGEEDEAQTTVKCKDVLIPVAFNWEEGKKYIYTFVFGNGNGGYNPDPNDPDGPDPVLVPITFEVSVDEFYQVNGGEFETPETPAE